MPAAVSLKAVLAVVYNGLIGTGFAYILWFAIIERLPTATASLGSLATPVVGVSSSMLMLGERPTTEDMIGFALIFAAALLRADAAGTAGSGAGAVSVLAKPRPPRPLDQEGPSTPGGRRLPSLFLGTLRMRTETLARLNSSCEPRPAR